MMFKPLTDAHGEAVLMSFLVAFHAQTSPVPEREQASTEKPAQCGSTWPGSLAKFDPDTHSWRTHQCLLFEDSTECLETFPRWGLMRDGELWEQSTPALRTEETESGLWPTPRAQEPGRTTEGYGRGLAELIEGKEQKQKVWPTPVRSDCQQRRKTENWNGNDLVSQVTELEELNGNKQPKAGGQLNPNWVEWLMGWPLGWTDCAASATDKFQQWLHSHGNY
jgi:hypothetical protein